MATHQRRAIVNADVLEGRELLSTFPGIDLDGVVRGGNTWHLAGDQTGGALRGEGAMDQSWRALLRLLGLTDADVYRQVAQTCRTQARFGFSPTDSQVGTVFSDVVVGLCRRYLAEPGLDYFSQGYLFLAAVRTAATHSYDPVEAPRRRRGVLFGPPDELPEPAAPAEPSVGGLDCQCLRGRCLAQANDRQREFFMAFCEGIRVRGEPPEYSELIPRLGNCKAALTRLKQEVGRLLELAGCVGGDLFRKWT